MINIDYLKNKIEKRFGEPLLYSQQCEALSQAIMDFTGERVSDTTLKRIFGFSNKKVTPRKSTLDSIAHYLGYTNWDSLYDEYIGSPMISEFLEIEKIEPKDLRPGKFIVLTYQPDRRLVLEYIGKNKFQVINAENSKLHRSDILTILQIYKDFELIVSNVEREGKSLGSYVAAKETGISSIKISKSID